MSGTKVKAPASAAALQTAKGAAMGNVDEMSADDMRNALYNRLHDKGLLDTLKSQLRRHLVAELKGRSLPGGKAATSKDRQSAGGLERRLLESLVYQYLCDEGCDYTVGVFLPEVGVTKREMLSREEMKALLTVSDERDSSLLQTAVAYLRTPRGDRLSDEATQTDSDSLTSSQLTDRLTHIDMTYSTRGRASSEELACSVEERLMSHQRKVELAAGQKCQQDFQRWKRLEIETLQMTEREKQKKELDERRRQLEEDYRRKVAAVTDRERALADSVKVEFESVQRETFQQRQQLLQQSEQLRQRETELREEHSHMARLQRVNEEKLEKVDQLLKRREIEVEQKELHLSNTLRTQQERCKLEERMSYDSKYRELKALEGCLADKESGLEREKRSLLTSNERKELIDLRHKRQELESQVGKFSLQNSGLEMSLTAVQERLAKMFDYEVIKESNISLKKDLEMTKDRLDSLIKEHSYLQEKYEHLLIDGREKAGVADVMLIKTAIQKERDRVIDDKVLLEHRLREMEIKLADQLRKNQDLVREFELQTDRQKYMNKEYGEMRKQLGNDAVESLERSRRRMSPAKEPSFYDTSFRRHALAPELALEVDWIGDVSSGAEVSTATEESIVTETRRRLDNLSEEAENLHSAFTSLTRRTTTAPAVGSNGRKLGSQHHITSLRGVMVDSHVTFLPESTVMSHAPMTHDLSVGSATEQRLPTSDFYGRGQGTAAGDPHFWSAPETSTNNFPQATESYSQADQFSRPTPNKPWKTAADTQLDVAAAGSGREVLKVPSSRPGETTAVNPSAVSDSQSQHKGDPLPSAHTFDSEWRTNETTATPSPDGQQRTNVSAEDTPLGLDSQWRSKANPAPSTVLDTQQQATPPSLDSQRQPKAATQATPTSLDSQWQPKAVTQATPTSLDGQWQSKTAAQAAPTLLDSQWQPKAATQAAPTSLDSQWQPKAVSTATSHDKQPEKAQGEDEAAAGIDPVMQKYMKMVQQRQRQQEQATSPTAAAKPELETAHDSANELSSRSERKISPARSEDGDRGEGTDEDFW